MRSEDGLRMSVGGHIGILDAPVVAKNTTYLRISLSLIDTPALIVKNERAALRAGTSESGKGKIKALLL